MKQGILQFYLDDLPTKRKDGAAEFTLKKDQGKKNDPWKIPFKIFGEKDARNQFPSAGGWNPAAPFPAPKDAPDLVRGKQAEVSGSKITLPTTNIYHTGGMAPSMPEAFPKEEITAIPNECISCAPPPFPNVASAFAPPPNATPYDCTQPFNAVLSPSINAKPAPAKKSRKVKFGRSMRHQWTVFL